MPTIRGLRGHVPRYHGPYASKISTESPTSNSRPCAICPCQLWIAEAKRPRVKRKWIELEYVCMWLTPNESIFGCSIPNRGLTTTTTTTMRKAFTFVVVRKKTFIRYKMNGMHWILIPNYCVGFVSHMRVSASVCVCVCVFAVWCGCLRVDEISLSCISEICLIQMTITFREDKKETKKERPRANGEESDKYRMLTSWYKSSGCGATTSKTAFFFFHFLIRSVLVSFVAGGTKQNRNNNVCDCCLSARLFVCMRMS